LRHELELLVEAAEQVQDDSTIRDRFAEVGEGVGHPLHLAAVFVDGEGALGEGAKFSIEEHGAGLAVVEELLLDADPGGASRDAVVLMNIIQKVGGDGVEDPGDDHAIHA
jgi:hypothetical protein